MKKMGNKAPRVGSMLTTTQVTYIYSTYIYISIMYMYVLYT